MLVDPEARTKGDVHFAMSFWKASPDGKYVAYGLSPSGSEDAVIEIIETATGKILPERIARAHYTTISWLPDSKSFFVNLLAEGAERGTPGYYNTALAGATKSARTPRQTSR